MNAATTLPAAVVSLTLLSVAGPARGADECGPAEPGVTIRCTPSGYDASADGNIFYRPGLAGGDFSLRLEDGLSVAYDAEAPDDALRLGDFDTDGLYRHGAVVAVSGDATDDGDIVVSSSAHVTATGAAVRGYLVGHFGASGNLRLHLERGSVAANGSGAAGILAFHASEGHIVSALRDVMVSVTGDDARGIEMLHSGVGGIDFVAHASAVEATGDGTRGFRIAGDGAGDRTVSLRDISVATGGSESVGVLVEKGSSAASGDLFVDVEGGRFVSEGRDARAVHVDYGTDGDIAADLRDTVLRAVGSGARAFNLRGSGHGDLRVTATDVDAAAQGDGGPRAFAVARRDGPGHALVDLRGGRFAADGANARGVEVFHSTAGDVALALRDVVVSAQGESAQGVRLQHTGTGAVDLTVEGGRIDAAGADAIGILASHGDDEGDSDFDVHLRDVTVSVEGDSAEGLWVQSLGVGTTHLAVEGGWIDAAGDDASGMVASFFGDGDGAVNVGLRDVTVNVDGEAAEGVRLQHTGAGDIDFDARGGEIVSEGRNGHGIAAWHVGEGDIDIRLRDTRITTTGEDGNGIVTRHETGTGSVRIHVDGGSVHGEGPGGIGVDVGGIYRATGELAFVAGVGEDGYRRQHVIVDGSVRGGPDYGDGDASGIWLGGGGRVEIGPRGSVGAASGNAIRAEGEGAALHVAVALDGRRVGDVFDGAIRNDNGRTTIAVNGTTLHDGMMGATGRWAPNGARDVTLVAADAVAGRAFSATDFATGPYTSRAAVYEALPGVLQRLDSRATHGERQRGAGSPAWVRLSGGRGSYAPVRSSVGASYDFDSFALKAGLDFGLSEAGDVIGSASLRSVRGSADVTAPTGGGTIEAEGVGISFGATWRAAAGYYTHGRVSLTRYEAELRSAARGRLEDDADATVRTVRVEVGRRVALGETTHLTPWAWLASTNVSLDGFRDAVGSRVSLDGAGRTDAGFGLVAERDHAFDDGARSLSLRGELGVERSLGDAQTIAEVSGERLRSEAAETRAVLGLGGAYRWNGYSLGGAVSVSGPGSDDRVYTATIRFAMRF